MAKISLVLVFLVALLLGKLSLDKRVDACYLDAVGGGCPDINACTETCRPCYRGVGTVRVSCVAPGGGIYIWRCRCSFEDGAPCPPVGPPTCPKPPASGRDFHRKIGGRMEHQDQPFFKYYDHHPDENVTENVISIGNIE